MKKDRPEGHPASIGGGFVKRLLSWLGIGGGGGCAPAPTPDEDLAIAYRVSADGELEHAAYHVACVLKADPTDSRATGLLDRLIAKKQAAGQDPLDLAPLGKGRKGTYAGVVGARAYVLAKLDRWAEAIEILRQLDHGDPQTPWWKWALDWLNRPGVVAKSQPEMVVGLLAGVVMRWDGDVVTDHHGRAAIAKAATALAEAARAWPADEMVNVLHIMAVRKSGDVGRAVELAETAWQATPTHRTGVARGMALKAAGDMPAAIAAFEDAARLDDTDESTRADLAEFCTSIGRYEDALKWADEAKARDANRTTSSWTLWYLLKHKLDPAGGWLGKLGEYQAKHPAARPPGEEAAARLGPWEAWVPWAEEATINVVKQVLEQIKTPKDKGGSVSLTVSALEAPSATLAARRAMEKLRLRLDLVVDKVPDPDPREPHDETRWPTWQYEGTEATPATPAGADAVRDAVAAIAGEPYDLREWSRAAGEVAQGLVTAIGTAPAAAEALVGVTVNPPPAPNGRAEWDWIRAIQVAAAVILSHVDNGWTTSARRDGLLSLVRGPIDWATEAGLVGLACVYREEPADPAARAEIEEVFRELVARMPTEGYCCYAGALSWAVRAAGAARGADLEGFEKLRERAAD